MLYLILFLLALGLTYTIKLIAEQKSIMDIPNDRSAHTIPIPRGGGLAIIIVFYLGLFYLIEAIEPRLFYALLCAIPVAIIGILDDIYTLSSKIRFLTQSISAILALYFLGGVNEIDFGLFVFQGAWVNILGFISILWVTNFYNFIDGIDGYAGSHAVMIGLALFLLFGNPLGLVIVVASLGFLLFNWDKASIFMGDVGSATLGFIFAVFIFYDTGQGNIFIWLILLSLLWFDTTLTLIRRWHNGEAITQAHNKHAYQRLVQSGWTHHKVSLYALAFNLFFLILLLIQEHRSITFGVNLVMIIIITLLIERKKRFI
ncbi:MAG: glycosyltransferase family 4 protein [Sulfurovum sp.]|nr:glycosyltransferase family 4 protein [Sulfurovum sp.]